MLTNSILFFVIIGLLSVHADRGEAADGDPGKTTMSYTRLRDEFASRLKAKTDKPLKPSVGSRPLDVLLRLLNELDTADLRAPFVPLTNTPPAETPGGFDDLLAQAFVERFLAANDVTALVSLMAAHAPSYIAGAPVEFALATSKLPAPIPVLKKAYLSSVKSSGKTLVESLRRGFPSLTVPGQSDEAFVKACEEWWPANGKKAAVNYRS